MSNVETANVNPPFFPEIKPSDTISERKAKVLKQFAPRIGEKTPYDSSEFECTSPIGEDARIALVKGMVSLPGTEGLELFRASENLEYISDNEATHKALDRMYTGPVSEDPNSLIWSRLFIENTHNSMAVRNRLRVVKEEFVNHMEKALAGRERSFHILSLSARSNKTIF